MWLSILRIVVHFKRDTKGAIAVVFTATLLFLTILIGISVDYVRWQNVHTESKDTLDAAVLAGGRVFQLPDTTDQDAIDAAYRYFEANRPAALETEEETVKFSTQFINNEWSIVGSIAATGRTKTAFIGMFGYESLPVKITSEAKLEVSNVEISMMLDITGSMGEGTKLQDLKEASKSLIDIVLNEEKFRNKSRIALVPFSTFVNVGETYFNSVTGTTVPNGNLYTCVAERNTSDRYTDEPPAENNYFTHLSNYYNPPDVCPTQSTVMPLTNDKETLKAHINDFELFRSSTAGHLATAFAWYMLSPKWKKVWWPDQDEDVDVDVAVNERKVAILMTDGRYNAQYSGDPSKDQALRLCDNIKSDGIVVYTVGFDIPKGSSADDTMWQCASSQAHYYNAANGEDLKAAYRDIAVKMFKLRLSQ